MPPRQKGGKKDSGAFQEEVVAKMLLGPISKTPAPHGYRHRGIFLGRKFGRKIATK
jgi:hypothetical protein